MTETQNAKCEPQYDKIGEAYLRGQNEFHNPRNDWARDFVRRFDVSKPCSKEEFAKTSGEFVRVRNNILDIGCGDGQDVKYFYNRQNQVWGIDESGFMVERSQTQFPAVIGQKLIRKIGMQNLESLVLPSGHAPNYDNKKAWEIMHGEWEKHEPEGQTSNGSKQTFFNYVFARYSLHYAPGDINTVYAQIHKVLDNGGLFAFVIPNPFADVAFTDTKNYATAKEVKVKIFNEQVEITYPFRKMEEIITPFFLRQFRVWNMEYYSDAYATGISIPAALGILAQKKSLIGVGNNEGSLPTFIYNDEKRKIYKNEMGGWDC